MEEGYSKIQVCDEAKKRLDSLVNLLGLRDYDCAVGFLLNEYKRQLLNKKEK